MRNFILYIVCSLLVVSIKCSSSSSSVAGGSGAGNPGGITTVSLIADTTSAPQGLTKELLGNPGNPGDTGPGTGGNRPPSLGVKDAGGLLISIDTLLVHIAQIRFILDSSENLTEVLDSFSGNLRGDSGAIILDTDILFNVLTGECFPPFDSIRLPQAHYTALYLVPHNGVSDTAMLLQGTFLYADTTRTLRVILSHAPTLLYPTVDAGFYVSRNDTTRCTIAFKSKKWGDTINLGACLDNHALSINNRNELILLDSNSLGSCTGAGAQFRANITGSGALSVRTQVGN